jgi:hypothetical protein
MAAFGLLSALSDKPRTSKYRRNKMKTILLILAIFTSFANFAVAGQTANIPITYLPFTISAPGTYVLVTDLTCAVNGIAITMNQQAVGDIVVNLNGHTLNGNNNSLGVFFSLNGGVNVGALVLKNGTVSGFYTGTATSNFINTVNSHLLIENVTFNSTIPKNNVSGVGIQFERVNGAVVSGCKFVGVMEYGVNDLDSASRNTYTSLSFDGQQSINIAEAGTYPQTLKTLSFQ